MSRSSLAVVLTVLLFLPATTRAAEQLVLGSQLQVKGPSTPDKRKVSLSAKEPMSNDTIVGDPVANGATLTIRITAGSPVNGDTYNLPSGLNVAGKPFWSGDATKGYKYKDSKGENGAVTSAAMSLKKGTLQIKVGIAGKVGPVNLVPPNPGADGCATLTINGGDSYSINFLSGVAKNSAKAFKIAKPTTVGSCAQSNPGSLPIDHIVVVMQENRSADTYLGPFSTLGQPAYEAEPNTGNPDPTNPMNPPIVPFHKTTYCDVADLDHSWKGTHQEVNNGFMNGFTTKNTNGSDPTGSRTMGYYDDTDLPYYYALHNTFATGDRYFSSVQSQTYPNRLFLLAGTSFGHIRNDVINPLDKPSIFNLLDSGNVSWRIYASEYPNAYGSTLIKYAADRAATRVVPIAQYFVDLANGTLPNVSFIDPDFAGTPKTQNDEHPISNVQVGQKFVADVINGLLASSAWSTSTLFYTYDEHGGYYDHVVPPAAVVPDATPPILLLGDPVDTFGEYGIRVPSAVISPYSKPHYVTHTVNDHTSILRFIENRFGLPALTARDAAADPMSDYLDFTNPPSFPVPPALPAAVIDPVKLAACPGA